MFKVRHHVTHSGAVTASPIYIEPDRELSNEELDARVQKEPDYGSLVMLKGTDYYDVMLETIRHRVRLRSLKKLVDHATVIHSLGGSFAVPGLRDVDWNFEHLSHTLTELLDQLSSFLENA